MEPCAPNNSGLAETRPDQLRALILDYLCNSCHTKTALALSKDSAVMHLDKDGDEIVSQSHPLGETLTELSGDVIRRIRLRERICMHILSGRVEEATACLNEHFPTVLDESLEDEADKAFSDDATPDQVQYRTTTTNPVHLALNLRILAFIEGCRTIPLIYPSLDPGSAVRSSPTHSCSPSKRDPLEEDSHQTQLLIRAQKLYAHVNSLRKPADRAIYQRELTNIGGLLAYKVPERSPIAKYLSQERRERVAEQINCAILHSMNLPAVSYIELGVRYTHCLWSALHTEKAKLPPISRWPAGVSLPPGPSSQSSAGSEKEPLEVPPFDLQRFLNTKT